MTLQGDSQESGKLRKAAADLRYLLNYLTSKGYQKRSVVRLVGDRYLLDKSQRHLLYRSICSEEEARARKAKLVSLPQVQGSRLAIDGYNVLITIESAIAGKTIILSDDGLVRDIAGVFGRYKTTPTTYQALELIFEALKEGQPETALFFLDSPISMSGELAASIRRMLKEKGLAGDARAVDGPGKELLEYGQVIASSDSILIDRAEKVFDLAGYVISKKLGSQLLVL